MHIRHADPSSDAAACAAIYGPFVADTAISFETEVPTTEEMQARIARVSGGYPWLVAEDAGEVAGFAYASRHRERTTYRWAADVSVYVSPGHHRRGVGRTLYAALFDLMRAQGLRTAISGITLPNPGSVALHEAFGFRQIGIYRRIGYKLGGWRDVSWWQLELVPEGDGPPTEPGPPVRLAD